MFDQNSSGCCCYALSSWFCVVVCLFKLCSFVGWGLLLLLFLFQNAHFCRPISFFNSILQDATVFLLLVFINLASRERIRFTIFKCTKTHNVTFEPRIIVSQLF